MGLPIWLIVVGTLVLILFILFKIMNQVYILSMIKDNFFWFFIVALFAFFAISLTHIHKNYDISFTSYEGLVAAGKIYLTWLKNVFHNSVQVTSYAIKQDWTNTNASFFNK